MKKRDEFLLSQVAAAWATRGRRRGINVAKVVHDDSCPRLVGEECNCTPEIIVNGARVRVPSA